MLGSGEEPWTDTICWSSAGARPASTRSSRGSSSGRAWPSWARGRPAAPASTRGGVPRRPLVRSGRIHRLVKEAGAFGTRTGPVSLDWDALVRRQHAIVRELQPAPAAFERAGAKVYLADARFVDAHTVQADRHRVQADRIGIAAGSEPVLPPLPGRELAITSDRILFLERFPESLVLVGAGVIGLEMASAFADPRARATLLGSEPEILPALDADVAAYLRALLEARGVTFHLGARVARLSGEAGRVTAHVTTGAGPAAGAAGPGG